MPQKDWKNLSSKDIDQNAIYPSVEQWLKGFETAKFILTDSFHAVVFAIIFNKPFLCIGNKERGLSRLNSLLEMFGMQNRMIYGKKDLTGILLHDIYKIDYQTINSKKETLKQISLDFLKQNLGV